MMRTLPPYAALMGVSADPDGDGAVLVMPFGEVVLGRPGFVHGGALAGLLELAAIVAVSAALEREAAGCTIKPVSVTTDFMRGGRDKDTRAAARIVRLGRRIANVEATAWQDDPAQPIASARVTFLVQRGEPRSKDDPAPDPAP